MTITESRQSLQEAAHANPRRPSIVPWKIGLLIDWAWATEPVRDYADAIALALDQAYSSQLIDRKVELITRKVYGAPNASALDVRDALRELVEQQRVLGMIGPTLPDDMMACRTDFDRMEVPVLSFGGTLSITSPWLFQLPNGSYVDEIRMVVNHAKAKGHTSIALIRDQSMMGEEYAHTFSLAMREAGLHVATIQSVRPAPKQTELVSAINAAAQSKADALLVITVAVHKHFVEALATVDWQPARYMVCNMVGSIPGFDGPSAFESWIGIQQYHEENRTFQAMVQSFEQTYQRHAAHDYQAIGYDIGRTLARALSMMAPATPEGLRDALEKVRMLPAAAGAPGTVISFAKNDRRGYKGDYLVYRTVTDGVNHPIGGMSRYIYG